MSVPGACAAFGAFNLAMLLVVAAMVDAIIGRSADAVLEILGSGLCFSLYRDR
jgi:hypothetical protein